MLPERILLPGFRAQEKKSRKVISPLCGSKAKASRRGGERALSALGALEFFRESRKFCLLKYHRYAPSLWQAGRIIRQQRRLTDGLFAEFRFQQGKKILNNHTNKNLNYCQEEVEHRGYQNSETTLYDTIMVDSCCYIYLSRSIKLQHLK